MTHEFDIFKTKSWKAWNEFKIIWLRKKFDLLRNKYRSFHSYTFEKKENVEANYFVDIIDFQSSWNEFLTGASILKFDSINEDIIHFIYKYKLTYMSCVKLENKMNKM